MKTTLRCSVPLLVACFAALCAATALSGCNDTATTAVVDNDFPAALDAGSAGPMTVYKVWWVTSLFATPVAAGAESESERTVPGSDYAYALLAPGWSPEQAGRPQRLVALKSNSKLSVSIHDTLHIHVSDSTFDGDCARGKPLTMDDARLITERIFPGDFAGPRYDPATCATSVTSLDADTGDAGDGDAERSDAGPTSQPLDGGGDMGAVDGAFDGR